MATPARINPSASPAGAKSLVCSTHSSLKHCRASLIPCLCITVECRVPSEFPRPRCADAGLQPNPDLEGLVMAPTLPAALTSLGVTPLMLLDQLMPAGMELRGPELLTRLQSLFSLYRKEQNEGCLLFLHRVCYPTNFVVNEWPNPRCSPNNRISSTSIS